MPAGLHRKEYRPIFAAAFQESTVGYGVMVTQQILVLLFRVRVLVTQQKAQLSDKQVVALFLFTYSLLYKLGYRIILFHVGFQLTIGHQQRLPPVLRIK